MLTLDPRLGVLVHAGALVADLCRTPELEKPLQVFLNRLAEGYARMHKAQEDSDEDEDDDVKVCLARVSTCRPTTRYFAFCLHHELNQNVVPFSLLLLWFLVPPDNVSTARPHF